jgi:hypothetical protein
MTRGALIHSEAHVLPRQAGAAGYNGAVERMAMIKVGTLVA